MAIPSSHGPSWDINKYKSEYESEEHWQLRKRFMEAHKDKFPEEKLVCLAQVFFNVEFLGCRYPEKTMQMVAELSKGVADEFREKQRGKLKRTFVQASDAAGSKIKGSSALSKMLKASDAEDSRTNSATDNCQVHSGLVKVEESEDFPGFVIYENCRPQGTVETCPINILTHSVSKNKGSNPWNTIQFDFPPAESQGERCCVITINNKFLSSASGPSQKEAKLNAAIEGLAKLRRTCYTVQAKYAYFSDNPVVTKGGTAPVEEDTPLPSNNIGSKMMQKMGWTGSGLGKLQQGIQTPVQAQGQIIKRTGLGNINHRDFQAKFRQVFKDFIASDTDNDLVFAPDFSSDERKTLHQLAQSLRLKTRSYGKNEDRRLVVFKVMPLSEVVNSLRRNGGENEKYLLIHPNSSS